MHFKTLALIFLLLSSISNSVSQRKATPEEELEDVEKIVSEMADMEFHDAEADGMFEEEVDEILWDGFKDEHGESNRGIARKSYDSGRDETSGDSSDIQEAVGEILASTEMPKFYGEMVDVSKTTFTIKLSHEELPRTIPFFEIVVLKLSTDSEGYPRLPKENSETWQTFIPYTKEPTPEHPYIAARFSRDDLPREFTVGDKRHYGGSYNGCLTPGSFFVMFVRGSQKHGDAINHVVSDYISSINEPNIAHFFHTESAPKIHILQLGLGLLAGLIVISAAFVVIIKRRQDGKKYIAVKDDGSASSEIDEFSIDKSQSSMKRKKLSKVSHSNTINTLKTVHSDKIISSIEKEMGLTDYSDSEETEESSNKESGSQNEGIAKTSSQTASGGEKPATGNNYKAGPSISIDLVSQREDALPKAKADKEARAEFITAAAGTGVVTPNSHEDETGGNDGKKKEKSDGRDKSDRTSLTIKSSGAGGEDIVKFRGRKNLSENLQEMEESDNELEDVDIGGYGMKRDGRNDKEYRAALRRRMEAYRWLINLKQDDKISPNVDIKLILAGKLDLPEKILKEKPAHIDLDRLKWDLIAFEEKDINSTGAELLT